MLARVGEGMRVGDFLMPAVTTPYTYFAYSLGPFRPITAIMALFERHPYAALRSGTPRTQKTIFSVNLCLKKTILIEFEPNFTLFWTVHTNPCTVQGENATEYGGQGLHLDLIIYYQSGHI